MKPTHLSTPRQMVELVKSGRTPSELAREYKPSEGSIRNWVAQSERDAGQRSDGLSTDELVELRRLRRENKQLRMERDILKRAATTHGCVEDRRHERDGMRGWLRRFTSSHKYASRIVVRHAGALTTPHLRAGARSNMGPRSQPGSCRTLNRTTSSSPRRRGRQVVNADPAELPPGVDDAHVIQFKQRAAQRLQVLAPVVAAVPASPLTCLLVPLRDVRIARPAPLEQVAQRDRRRRYPLRGSVADVRRRTAVCQRRARPRVCPGRNRSGRTQPRHRRHQ